MKIPLLYTENSEINTVNTYLQIQYSNSLFFIFLHKTVIPKALISLNSTSFFSKNIKKSETVAETVIPRNTLPAVCHSVYIFPNNY